MHKAYELLDTQTLKDIDSIGYVLRHKKSGAHLCVLKNDDDNKVFYIGFRTPPHDSTGVAHILEHSVLCGSKKYPLKDPFVELVKGSLNTFLNAMTYPDKTVYPVASCNDKDFANLMDVYLDAVFYPNIYSKDEIMQQEGWHYELEDVDGPLTINGVVYNEMKGAFSSPDDVLSREVLNSLFPDTTYANESGGDPKNIPDLTKEDFLEFHSKFYHPSNSYIYLYGDMDIEERLDYLDKEYLSKFDAIEVDSEIKKQAAFDKPVEIEKEYPIAETDDEEETAYFALNYVTGDILDQKLYVALEILDYAILQSNGAPLRKKLLESGICKDILGGADIGTLQPVFSVIAKGCKLEDREKFASIVRDTLAAQAKEGINKEDLKAVINATQFKVREADFGSYPKGLIYGLNLLDSWLYSKTEPLLHLHTMEILDQLAKDVETDYFDRLLKDYIVENNHSTFITLKPKKGLTAKEDAALEEKLAAYKATLSKEECQAIVDATKHLKEYQSAPETEEALATIPVLKRSDLKREVRKIINEEKEVCGIKVVHHSFNTFGINYLNLVFDVCDFSIEELQYMTLVTTFMGLTDVGEYSYEEFVSVLMNVFGGLRPKSTIESCEDGSVHRSIQVRGKYLYENTDKAAKLLKDYLSKVSFENKDRVMEILNMTKAQAESAASQAGHVTARSYAMAQIDEKAYISDLTNGVRSLDFLNDAMDLAKKDYDAFKEKLYKVYRKAFSKNRLLVSTAGNEMAIEALEKVLPTVLEGLSDEAKGEYVSFGTAPKERIGLTDASQIQYVSKVGEFKSKGYEPTGVTAILKTILGYEYFWNEVRVKGGAYGCMCDFTLDGKVGFVSYRDPNLKSTIDVFDGTGDFLRNFDATEEEMTKYIIGTMSNIDAPLTLSQRATFDFSNYIKGRSEEERQARRNQILDATAEDIKALAGAVEVAMKENILCVVGNEANINESQELFDVIKPIKKA